MSATRRQVLDNIARRIAGIERPHPIRVAIDGVDASGKTQLAEELAPIVEQFGRPIVRASVDGFHQPRATRHRQGALSPEGYFEDSFNYPDLIDSVLAPLGPGGSRVFRRATFDFRTDTPLTAIAEAAPTNAVLLLDGVFLLRDELRAYFDFSIFVRAVFSVTLRRAEHRDYELFGSVQAVRERYTQRYIPGQQIYLNTAQPERWASVIVDNDDPANPSLITAATRSV